MEIQYSTLACLDSPSDEDFPVIAILIYVLRNTIDAVVEAFCIHFICFVSDLREISSLFTLLSNLLTLCLFPYLNIKENNWI